MKRMRVGWVMLVIAALLLAGCARGQEQGEGAGQGDPLSQAIAEANLAAAAVKTAAERGEPGAVATAYERFSLAFGEVLGPVSLADPLVAQKMANANSAIKEMVARGKVEAGEVAHHVAIIQLGLQESTAVMAAAKAGAQGAGGDEAPADLTAWGRSQRTIDVVAVDYRFKPAEIRVKKGTKVTIRFANQGTEEHEFELEAYDFEIGRTQPGKTASKSFVADRAGRFSYECHVDDHLKRGMKGILIVEE